MSGGAGSVGAASAGGETGGEPAVEGWSRVCRAEALAERGEGVRFDVLGPGGAQPAFVLRIEALPRAWLNRCAHVPVELDWTPGRFLDDTGTVIVCATHGALYDAEDGRCVGGPCRGRGLHPLDCRESEGWIEVRAAIAGERG